MDLQTFLIPISFFFLLILGSGCGPTKSASTITSIPTILAGGSIHINGTLTYDFVSASSAKLDYADTIQKPIRNVFVELLNAADNSLISSTSTNDLGEYAFSIRSGGIIRIRIYAEMKKPPVVIQDNTNGNAEYALLSPAYNITASTVKDIRAVSGWSGTNSSGSYTGTRVAAPFAIIDSVYTINKKIFEARPEISFPLLKINWSINNIATTGDVSSGEITTSHYDSSDNQLYILGKADVDTDEYDNHVIVHEWGHFLESNISRSDSFGGNHSFGDEKDMSLAFSEGWGNAVSAMAFDPDTYYADTSGSRQQSGFRINLESSTDTNKGWFSETSIQEILYDIYDSTNEAGDNLSLGIGPIVDVLTNYQKATPAMTSIFSFIYGLKLVNPNLSSEIDTLLATKNITAINNPYGSDETNNGGWDKNLPIYNPINLDGVPVPISLYGNFGASDFYGLFNTIFNNKYLRFTATSATTRLDINSTDTFELNVYKNGVEATSEKYEERSSSNAFGPFAYTFSTIPGQVYVVKILTDQGLTFMSAIVNLTVAATAL